MQYTAFAVANYLSKGF